jgi:hypothetical protein
MEWFWARRRAKAISLVDLDKPDNEAQNHSSPALVAPQPPFREVFLETTPTVNKNKRT